MLNLSVHIYICTLKPFSQDLLANLFWTEPICKLASGFSKNKKDLSSFQFFGSNLPAAVADEAAVRARGGGEAAAAPSAASVCLVGCKKYMSHNMDLSLYSHVLFHIFDIVFYPILLNMQVVINL